MRSTQAHTHMAAMAFDPHDAALKFVVEACEDTDTNVYKAVRKRTLDEMWARQVYVRLPHSHTIGEFRQAMKQMACDGIYQCLQLIRDIKNDYQTVADWFDSDDDDDDVTPEQAAAKAAILAFADDLVANSSCWNGDK